MTWWQTLLIATAPALVTVLGLLFQLKLTLGSQAHQQKAVRDDAATTRALQRKAELEDHWRAERLEAHMNNLSAMRAFVDQCLDLWGRFREGTPPGLSPEAQKVDEDEKKRAYVQLREALPEFRQAKSAVELLSGPATRRASAVAWESIEDLRRSLIPHGARSHSVDWGSFPDLLGSFSDAEHEYRESVRTEVGTDGGPRISGGSNS